MQGLRRNKKLLEKKVLSDGVANLAGIQNAGEIVKYPAVDRPNRSMWCSGSVKVERQLIKAPCSSLEKCA